MAQFFSILFRINTSDSRVLQKYPEGQMPLRAVLMQCRYLTTQIL